MSEPAVARPVVLETTGLTKNYGRRRVVDQLDLTVREGDVFGFLGPNGAGKSTTIRMILGLIRPTAGSVRLMGHDLARDRLGALRQVGAQVEAPAFYTYLSGYRNLMMLGSLSGPVGRDDIEETLRRVRLKGREGDKVRTYSQGMRMRLGLAQALLPQPRFLILDEPTNGLDPQGMKEVRELVRQLAHEEGITIFISSHLLAEVQQICDQVAIINQGRLVVHGAVSTLLAEQGETSLEVGCDPVERALELLQEPPGWVQVRSQGEQSLLLQTAASAAEVNRRLVAGGVAVHRLVPQQHSLEELFLALTGDGQ
ncbi:MAG: ABC transporter ATP-binding protein [Fimbriimonadaceae bacterium]|nr:ABC transporter ATP-binding protein [Fimbriimonadaceae bacterium]